MSADPHNLAIEIKQRARAQGFDLVGIASAEPSRYRDYFRQWLDTHRHGTMSWLANRFDERTNPQVYFPGAKSIICVAMNYFVPLEESPSSNVGRIARYALGDDYHEIIKPRLHELADWLKTLIPGVETRCAVDTAPVMEKELAARAGIGWLAKNTCIINEESGSWLLLGEILTTLDLPPDAPATDRCGTCTRCIDACPTNAITAPYELDATRCISYQTIEHRGDPTENLHGWLYGCDVCQDVCPWNRRAVATLEPKLQPRFKTGSLNLNDVQSWTPEDYQQNLRHSALKRVKLPILQRTARHVAPNETR